MTAHNKLVRCHRILFSCLVLLLCQIQVGYADTLSDLLSRLDVQEQLLQAQAKELQELREKVEELQQGKVQTAPEAPAEAAETPMRGLEGVAEKTARWSDKVTLSGSLWEFYLRENNAYFGKTNSDFLETVAKVRAQAQITDHIAADIRLVAENVSGDAADYTFVTNDDWNIEPDLVNISYNRILDMPLSVKVGRQNLEYGDGFLIYDGGIEQGAVWTSPIRSFYAVKGIYEGKNWQLEGFAAQADRDYPSYETYLGTLTTTTGKRNLYGGNVHVEQPGWGIWDLGVFYRADDSDLDSDTVALSQRGSYTWDLWPEEDYLPKWTLEGEIVEEFGRTKVKDYAATTLRHDRLAFGGHLDSILSFEKLPFTPFVRGSAVYVPGDDPQTATNEAFDPMFYGFKDWGKWFIGSMNSYNLFNYNSRIWTTEVGLYPTSTTQFRVQHVYSRLDYELVPNAGKAWSHEFDFIFDWYPNEWFYAGIEFGLNHPLQAARNFAGDDRTATEMVVWAGVEF